MQKGLTNITDLRWDWAFDTAELLDGTVEIVSVANYDAHNELHIGLEKKSLQPENYPLKFSECWLNLIGLEESVC